MHGYRLHQLQGNGIYGFRKSGYLLKKSEGKMGVKVWRKRRCEIKDGFLFIYHSDESQQPAKLNLLTCQVKLVPGKEKKCFDLISFNRTYHFQVEDEHDITAWVYVLINCKEGALKKQFDDSDQALDGLTLNNNGSSCGIRGGGGKDFVDFPGGNQQHQAAALHRLGTDHIQKQLIRQVQALNGNNRCVDCSTTKESPTWLSTNLGVLTCIECSGIHRELGVHISRIQSLTLDNINTSQLLIAHNMGNEFFNEVFESKLASQQIQLQQQNQNQNQQQILLAGDLATPQQSTIQFHREHQHDQTQILGLEKLKPNSTMDERCEFIKAKYLQKKFCHKIHKDRIEQIKSLEEAIRNKDLKLLLQLFGEGFDIGSCVSPENQETSIHLALNCQAQSDNIEFECDLFILDFLILNSKAINTRNSHGETPLHYCAKFNLPECMKLLLRSGADTKLRDNQQRTPQELVESLKPKGYQQLVDTLMASV